ncbi:DUF4270 domain-containing protein [Dysgonomonas gadei]|uniref:DUF4270 domain-containing protein n=1 Tax=Dysgonomonas gadei ATCC BAA-286 TaxID=742766 RepID=F5IUV2_9BACT|nr:DUF4270 domain-containing protein [Dysgonomonas gadei]EGK03002.1 hypothetical protein HMPREF9455_01252 [Dysgonomonas gadei ATCC BAA-286]
MKIKTLLILAITLSTLTFVACDDDLTSLGSSIQPGGDDIFVGSDTLSLTAVTRSFNDSVYARTVYGLLGEYTDPIFGKIKSDYLCEFYCAENSAFADPYKKGITIDSVRLNTEFTYFTGDTVSPMGLSVYEVTKPLKAFFFTSVNPENYCDMQKLLGQSIFSIQDVPDTIISSTRIRTISTNLNLELGQRFYNEWEDSDGATFKNSNTLKEFFKGVYVTTNFGSGSIINVDYTEFDIHYTYQMKNVANTADSAVAGIFRLPVTPEVIQMNHVKNSPPAGMITEGPAEKTYMNTPAGLYTEVTIPLDAIVNAAVAGAGKDAVINAANFKMLGNTEEEAKSGLSRPSDILFINKDSLPNFFYNRKLHDAQTSFVTTRSTTNNSYDFGNLASVINHYAKYYKEKGVSPLPDLKYLVIPVTATYTQTTNSSGYTVNVITDLYNQMFPTSAILRTEPKDMKMSIIYSKY